MTFEKWLDACDRIDKSVSGIGIYRPSSFWREQFDAGHSPKLAIAENYDGAISGAEIDEALAANADEGDAL